MYELLIIATHIQTAAGKHVARIPTHPITGSTCLVPRMNCGHGEQRLGRRGRDQWQTTAAYTIPLPCQSHRHCYTFGKTWGPQESWRPGRKNSMASVGECYYQIAILDSNLSPFIPYLLIAISILLSLIRFFIPLIKDHLLSTHLDPFPLVGLDPTPTFHPISMILHWPSIGFSRSIIILMSPVAIPTDKRACLAIHHRYHNKVKLNLRFAQSKIRRTFPHLESQLKSNRLS